MAADLRDLPLKLDSSRMYNLYPPLLEEGPLSPSQHIQSPDYLGGLEWSGGMKRYLKGILPVKIAHERAEEARQRREWWTHPYILNRLEAAHQVAPADLRILIDLLSSGDPYWQVSRRWQKSIGYLRDLRVRVTQIIKTWYYPRSPRTGDRPTQSSGEPVQPALRQD